MADAVSELFDPSEWVDAAASVTGSAGFTDITYHHSTDGRIARIAFDRPEVRNAFRPHSVDELYRALEDARTNPRIGVVLLTGNGPSPKDGGWAFCSGGDQRIRGRDGYQYSDAETANLPPDAVAASLGCGNPTAALIDLHPGQTVADLGSGGWDRCVDRCEARGAHRQSVRTRHD